MKKRFTENQIVAAIKKQERGIAVKDICRELGISQATFYGWKAKYSGLEVNQLKRMKELEVELAQFKKIVAEQVLQISVLKDVVGKKL